VRLEIKAEAREDLSRIYAFNIQRSEQWAVRVESRLLERSEALLSSPNVGRPGKDPEVRQLSVPDIQYVIDYRTASDMIEILRFRSTREIR
jgi:plasmid stabilization system protein ParE